MPISILQSVRILFRLKKEETQQIKKPCWKIMPQNYLIFLNFDNLDEKYTSENYTVDSGYNELQRDQWNWMSIAGVHNHLRCVFAITVVSQSLSSTKKYNYVFVLLTFGEMYAQCDSGKIQYIFSDRCSTCHHDTNPSTKWCSDLSKS